MTMNTNETQLITNEASPKGQFLTNTGIYVRQTVCEEFGKPIFLAFIRKLKTKIINKIESISD